VEAEPITQLRRRGQAAHLGKETPAETDTHIATLGLRYLKETPEAGAVLGPPEVTPRFLLVVMEETALPYLGLPTPEAAEVERAPVREELGVPAVAVTEEAEERAALEAQTPEAEVEGRPMEAQLEGTAGPE